jgi:hypothetical protein
MPRKFGASGKLLAPVGPMPWQLLQNCSANAWPRATEAAWSAALAQPHIDATAPATANHRASWEKTPPRLAAGELPANGRGRRSLH